MVFHKMPYFLQLFAENLSKTQKHGSLHEKLLVWPNRQVLIVLHKMPYFLQLFAENLSKTLDMNCFSLTWQYV